MNKFVRIKAFALMICAITLFSLKGYAAERDLGEESAVSLVSVGSKRKADTQSLSQSMKLQKTYSSPCDTCLGRCTGLIDDAWQVILSHLQPKDIFSVQRAFRSIEGAEQVVIGTLEDQAKKRRIFITPEMREMRIEQKSYNTAFNHPVSARMHAVMTVRKALHEIETTADLKEIRVKEMLAVLAENPLGKGYVGVKVLEMKAQEKLYVIRNLHLLGEFLSLHLRGELDALEFAAVSFYQQDRLLHHRTGGNYFEDAERLARMPGGSYALYHAVKNNHMPIESETFEDAATILWEKHQEPIGYIKLLNYWRQAVATGSCRIESVKKLLLWSDKAAKSENRDMLERACSCYLTILNKIKDRTLNQEVFIKFNKAYYQLISLPGQQLSSGIYENAAFLYFWEGLNCTNDETRGELFNSAIFYYEKLFRLYPDEVKAGRLYRVSLAYFYLQKEAEVLSKIEQYYKTARELDTDSQELVKVCAIAKSFGGWLNQVDQRLFKIFSKQKMLSVNVK